MNDNANDTPGEGYPLSPQQRRLWAAGGRDSGSPFEASAEIRIRGPVQDTALRAAVADVVARHEILRTGFYRAADMSLPLQVIGDGGIPESIELRPGAADDYRLRLRLPALCSDRRGLDNLAAALRSAYAAHVRGETGDSQPLQYADAAAWLNAALESDDAAAGRELWRGRSAPASAPVPFERASRGAFQPRAVSAGPVAPMPDAPGIVLACWVHLLQRLTDSPSVPVAIEDDGRQYAELDDAIGLYARLLPLAPTEAPGASASALAATLGQAVADARRWADAFDPRLYQGTVDAGRLWPYAFEHRRDTPPADAAGVTFEPVASRAHIDRVGLKLVFVSSTVPELVLEYDASCFDETDVADLAIRLQQLIGHAAAAPAVPLDSFSLATDADAATLCGGPETPVGERHAPLCVQTFERWAVETPEAPAVTCDNATLTFAGLNARANQIAHRLIGEGVVPDTAVGLCLERSVDLVAGMLGILKAGGGYVPLDPRAPAARREAMLAAAGVQVVVTSASQPSGLGTARSVLVDDSSSPLDREPSTNPAVPVRAEHLAYVLFTSGSTGQPKGVAVEHGQLSQYVDAVRDRLDLPERASYATVTTVTADLGNTCVFPSVMSGGHLHVIADERCTDAEAFAEYAAAHAIDVLKIVPSHLRALLTAPAPARVLPRQRLVLGGESCPWDLVRRVRELAPACRIFNHYGPTETTVGATAGEVPAEPRHESAGVPVGPALAHASTYVLDAAQRPVPVWFPGELFVGGGGVARGYVNTAAAQDPFLPDPFVSARGARMYRTGDRVRRLGDGSLEFLGRADDQVKVRGFRIEPGEIEAALRAHASVHEAVVLVRQSESGERTLAAFVSGLVERPETAALRTHLTERLPDYMVPPGIVTVASIPRTPNGKIDRSALLAIASERAAAATAPAQAPATDWERAVAEIWGELLPPGEIGAHDNFYDLGGHSLMAIQVVTAIEKRHGVRVAARELVFHTLRQFAALCQGRAAAASGSTAADVRG